MSKDFKALFQDPLTEAHLMFIDSFLPHLTGASLTLQAGEPNIHRLYSVMHETARAIITRFAVLNGANYDLDELVELPGNLKDL